MIHIRTLVCAAVAAAMLTGCSLDKKDGNIQRTTYTYSGCFNAVTDMATGVVTTFTDPVYEVVLQSDGTAALLISNLVVEQGQEPQQLKGTNLTWDKTAEIWQQVKDTEATWTSSDLKITNLVFRQLLRTAEYGGPVYDIHFTVNDRWAVCALPKSVIYSSITTVNNPDMALPFTYDNTRYSVMFNLETRTADLDINAAKFAEAMPPMNIQLRSLPVTFTKSGYRISTPEGEVLTPYMKDVPMPSYPMRNLKIDANMFQPGNLTFSATPGQMGSFDVVGYLEYVTRKSNVQN